MRPYSDMTTRRLEALALKLGVDCQIRTIEAQEDGRYFVMAVNEQPLKQPVPLGFTVDRAIHSLNAGTWERYALSGEPTRLGPPQTTRRSPSGRTATRRQCASF